MAGQGSGRSLALHRKYKYHAESNRRPRATWQKAISRRSRRNDESIFGTHIGHFSHFVDELLALKIKQVDGDSLNRGGDRRDAES